MVLLSASELLRFHGQLKYEKSIFQECLCQKFNFWSSLHIEPKQEELFECIKESTHEMVKPSSTELNMKGESNNTGQVSVVSSRNPCLNAWGP